MKIDKTKLVQITGVAGSLLGLGASLLTAWSNDKKMDSMVEKKVMEILEKKLTGSK
jgi:hypothetical protein